MVEEKQYIVVTDPGIDDMIALLLLDSLLPKSNHTLVATFGNAPFEATARNTKEFIGFVASQWKYKEGASQPINPLEHPYPDYFHGPDGVWNVHPNSDVNNISPSLLTGMQESVISLGPLTSVYELITRSQFKELVIMGGAIHEVGNETQYAETNIAFDPDAAQGVFSRCERIDTKLIPLDVTRRIFWTYERVKKIPENNPRNKWAKELLSVWFEKCGLQKDEAFILHDPLAVYLTFFPNSVEWIQSGVEVILEGAQRGRTIFSNTKPTCQIAMRVPQPEQVADKIFEILFS